MINIIPIPAFEDNYIWLLQHERNVVVIDPGDAEPVMAHLRKNNWALKAILITHHHHDHIGGVQALLAHYPVKVYAPGYQHYPFDHIPVRENDEIHLNDISETFKVLWLPGHTLDHIAYVNEQYLFSGDVLFGAGCGRLFEGTPTQMLHSLNKIKQLPLSTKVYCTHEYTLKNIQFALTLEPDNIRLQAREAKAIALRKQHLPTIPSTLEEEMETNPFLRCLEPDIKQNSGVKLSTEIDVFTAIRQLRNHY
ncbi:MAG: hydroxyacylglutathione hydrolase [Methylophilaceae bacterium 17-44-8]|jgi:hydroxyacylglutathione hydrolase|nr:MAG: hydroxyacylglutathione hydrolase [Methylophilales bacterium 28-44-11]OYY93611.1 MAG: hydroxyacylglutathione hydrolase [Methylophilales bacterium 16-45-7]OZA06643.1 MAG: hydroxyacylglutathione hydrolase [Methylophilaceae bacterium 17-44-8]